MSPLVKVSVRYGVLAGIVGSFVTIGLYYMGAHPLLIPAYMDFRIVLCAIFIFFALREIRDYHYEGKLHLWQGLFASFLFAIIYGILASAILVIFMLVVPAFLADYIVLATQLMKSYSPGEIEKMGKEIFNSNLEKLPATNAYDIGWPYFFGSLRNSLFLSIILSVILRRQPKT